MSCNFNLLCRPVSANPSFQRHRGGFTLVELLVVILIIGVLMAILLPAVQSARNTARGVVSKNNLRQIQLAMMQHEVNKGYLPPSSQFHQPIPGYDNNDGWSIFALTLPYLEQTVLSEQIDFRNSYNNIGNVALADGTTTLLTALRVPTYVSPNEPRDEARFDNGALRHYPINYAVNLGTWFVYDPATGKGGVGAAYPNSKLQSSRFTDGTSTTLGFAEVKAWNPYYRNAGMNPPPLPTAPADICSFGGDFKANSGHTEWVDGRSHQTGFTTMFRPNERVLCTVNGIDYDVDWNNWQEGKGIYKATPDLIPTYAAVTARSYSGDSVNVSMMDGSVRAISNNINLGVWRAISTRAGKENLPDDFSK